MANNLILAISFGFKLNSNLKSMEYMDFKITARDTSFRLLVIYRMHPSRKNKLTSSVFFEEFSTLFENLILTTPKYLLLTGDFNFHMDVPLGPDATKCNDLLELAELKQSVIGPTHRCVHTLDLVIDHQEESMLSPLLETLSDLPSDHYGVAGSLNFPKARCTAMFVMVRRS